MVLFGYPTASIFEKEDYAAMTLLGAVMAGYHYPGGWLHNELRGEGLVYAVHALQDDRARAGLLRDSRPDPARQARRGRRPHRAQRGAGERGPHQRRRVPARPRSG